MISTSVIISALIIFVSYSVHKFYARVSPDIPFAGGESFLSRLKVPIEYGVDPVGFLTRQRAKLGDVFCVDLYVLKLVFFLGPEGNRLVLRAHEDDLSFWEMIRVTTWPRTSKTIDFPNWTDPGTKAMRTGLLKQERLENYAESCKGLADEYFSRWAEEDSIPLFKSISRLIHSYLMVIFVGEDFYRKHQADLIPILASLERDLQQPILRLLPWKLWRLSGPGGRILHAHDRFDELMREEANLRYANPEKYTQRSDYFSYICSSFGPEFIPVYGVHIMSLIFGGHANAAMTIPWMYLHARRRPGALDTWREEVMLGPNAKKPFLEACQRETGRLYTLTSVLRKAKSDVTLAGHSIKKGTMVACSPATTQRDPAVYRNPESWRPERFLEEGAFSRWFQKSEYVQFGMGVHSCPGEKLAKIFIFDLVLKAWLEKYDVEVVSGLQEGVKGVDGVGAEAAWTEDNFGTPSVRGEDVLVRIRRRDPTTQAI